MNLFDLFVKIKLDDEASDKVAVLSGKIGHGLETAAKIGVAAVGAASTGIVALTKSAIDSYADYEQLVGGVETLFKDSAATVQGYAANAYLSSGLSANKYMETVTSFSASLISSLGGDTAAAAEYGNQALIDMSDNANKMGSDMEMIIQTYQSLSRGNFAMLDNLKLGYGGTKAEMERLIADANAVKEANGEMADLSIDSFADMTEAIHIIQSEMGITGTTAAEASETISGSIGAMRAAWQNLMVGIADDNADFDLLIDNMISTVEAASNNILPRVEVALVGVSKLINALLPEFASRVPVVIAESLPIVVDAAVNIVESIVKGISDNGQMLTDTALDSVLIIVDGLISMLPELLETGVEMVVTLVNGISEKVPDMIPDIVDAILVLVEAMTSPDTLIPLLDAGIEILLAVVEGVISAVPELVDSAPRIVRNFVDAIISAVPRVVDAGWDLIAGLWDGISQAGGWLMNRIYGFLDDIVYNIKDFFGIASPSKLFRDDIGKMLALGIGVGFDDEIEKVGNMIQRSVDDIVPSVGIGKVDSGIFSSNGSFAGGVSVVQNIYSTAKTAADLMEEALYQQERAVMLGV